MLLLGVVGVVGVGSVGRGCGVVLGRGSSPDDEEDEDRGNGG